MTDTGPFGKGQVYGHYLDMAAIVLCQFSGRNPDERRLIHSLEIPDFAEFPEARIKR